MAPVYVDGERVVTLRGDNIAAEFRQIVDDYVAKNIPQEPVTDRLGRIDSIPT